MKAQLCITPYGIDNELNKWGDYIALLRVSVDYDGSPQKDFLLIGKPGVEPLPLTREQYLSACENLAIQAGACAFIPKPV